jgi:hypothetical protein
LINAKPLTVIHEEGKWQALSSGAILLPATNGLINYHLSSIWKNVKLYFPIEPVSLGSQSNNPTQKYIT